MSARIVATTAWTCGRGLLTAQVWLAMAAALGALAGLARLAAPRSPPQAWQHATGLLWLATWLPGLCVALRLRQAWPALGAGDPARAWIARHASSTLLPRLGAMAGALATLLVLQVAVAAGFGVLASCAAPAPPFATGRPLTPTRPEQPLVHAGDFIELHLPARTGPSELRLRPRPLLGPDSSQATLAVEARLGAPTEAGAVGRLELAPWGETAALPLPPGPMCTLRLVRLDTAGPALAVDPDSAWLVSTRLPAPIGCALLALRPLAWAIVLLLAALALAPLVSAGVAEVAVLGLGLPLALLTQGGEPPIQQLLTSGLVVAPGSTLLRCLPLASAVLAVACLGRSRGRAA